MKKVFAILLSVLLVCALATAVFAAYENSSSVLTTAKTELKRGETFTVTAVLTNSDELKIGTVALLFDESVFELTKGKCLVEEELDLGKVATAQKAGTFMLTETATVTGDIFSFTMKVKEDAPIGAAVLDQKTSIGIEAGNYITATGLNLTIVCDHVFDKEVVDAQYLATEATCQAKATYYKSCSICGAKGTETFAAGELAAHTYDKEVVAEKYEATPATCTQKGTYYKSCVCGAKGTETFVGGELAAHTYDKEVVDAQYLASEATCTAKATYYKSCVCGAKGTETFAAGELAAHTYDKEVVAEKYEATPATCTQKGTYYKSCVCGAKGTETFVGGELAAHEYTKEVEDEAYFAAEATCTSGKTYYKLCAACDAVSTTETFEVGEPIAHTFDKEVVDAKYLATEATCKAKATYYKSCVCGAKGTETFAAGELAEHKFGEGKITTEPTAEKAGVKTYTCEVCGETKTEEVPYVETPATGDTAILLPMILLAVMSICGMAVVVVMKKRAA